MANPPLSAPLYDRISRRNNISRAIELIILFLLFSLLLYRLLSLKDHGFTWVLALLCESWFTFTWVLVISTKWNQVDYLTYTKRLLQRKLELPPVDMFVTTADPALEPPILTVNTVLSLLAVDYPADKLACYVSDDGASPLTFYSLVEASKFAKIWVPFCKKYNVQIRAPFRFFSVKSTSPQDVSLEFQQEWKKMKDEYEKLSQKIEDASKRSQPCELTGDFADFTNIQRKNHPTIIKVIWENKEGVSNGVPHVIYVSREKRPKHLHHFKAGAMNILVGEPVIFIPIALFAIYNLYTLSEYLRIGLSTRAWWNNQRIWRHSLVVGEPVIFIPIALFAIYNLYTLSEYLRIGLSTRAWWNNQRIWRLNTMIAWSFGVLSVLLKLLGLSDTVFEVTQKDQSTNVDDNNANAGKFTFDDSPSFVLGTTILLVNLTALAIGLLRFRLVGGAGNGSGIGEFICSMWVVLCFWAFLRGLFGKGKYGIPSSIIYKSGALALLFVQSCKWV
ncbi:hypothetical protein TEA_007853 [Camellia sinensis var. sinensis]|uniref:Uncharacterized protein n=1 Tax=Camellia sinensis var. sinensis TaxID=542762 RepID=A0A4S4EBK0_CAMSN|nr:hypothetical protein TEA_007853 [Camellia sinensis var. sinensis]